MMVRKIKKVKTILKQKNKLKCKFIKNNYKNFIIYPVNKKKKEKYSSTSTKNKKNLFICMNVY